MHPIVFHTSSITLYTYSVCMALGLFSAIAWTLWAAARRSIDQGAILDLALFTSIVAILGARLFEVLQRWDYFQQYPEEMFRLWQGNFGFQGGLLGGIVALALACYLRKQSFWEIAGLAAPGIALATTFGWLGMLMHGANYGFPTFGPLAVELPDLYGIVVPRFPTQTVGVIWSLLIFALLIVLSKRGVQSRTLALLWLFLYAWGMFALAFSRADETLYLGILRLAQLFYLAEGVGAGILLLLARRPKSPE